MVIALRNWYVGKDSYYPNLWPPDWMLIEVETAEKHFRLNNQDRDHHGFVMQVPHQNITALSQIACSGFLPRRNTPREP
jgi:hypothetical protein